MKLSEFDYELPKHLIAQYPLPRREESRMMVIERKSGALRHCLFKDLPDYIDSDDIVVFNDTKVMNARLFGRRKTGGKVEILILEVIEGTRYKVLLRPSGRIREGETVEFPDSSLRCRVVKKAKGGHIVTFDFEGSLTEELERIGNVPLPPYIKRRAEAQDETRYQTVYASEPGATAAPTAGLHFSGETINGIIRKGVRIARLTLHTSYGTFAPVRSPEVSDHKMHGEKFRLESEAASMINGAKEAGGKVLAVGTTSTRAMESCAVLAPRAEEGTAEKRCGDFRLEPREGETDLFIYPGYQFKIVDRLVTNFHLPKSTLLLLVSAFAGKEMILGAYKEAVRKRYRFFSYGDCMLIV